MKLLKRLETEKREFIAPVLVPDEVDYHSHSYSEEEVHKACRNYQSTCGKANLQHDFDLAKDSAEFVEHYIAPTEMHFADADITVKKGTWLATMKIKNDSLWQDVKDGKFTGFSISANCLSRKVQKSKVAGSAAGEEGFEVEKRLFDMDFSKEEHHVALVDEAANATRVLVLKAKEPKQKEVTMTLEEKAAQEALIKANLQKEQKELEVKKAKEVELETLKKAKADQDTELEELRKAKKQADADKVELEELKKAKEVAETAELVKKATDLKADDADVFGALLRKCKYSLEASEYEVLVKQLEKLENIEKNKEILAPKGEANAENVQKSLDEKIMKRRQEHIDAGVMRHEASKKARQEITAEAEAANK
jgi:hypothetical protein